MEAEEDNINKYIAQALLSQPISSRKESLEATLPRFSESLKENFENKNLWKQFALTLYLIDEPPRRTLQALKECLRIDKHDPVPAMLAAKLLAETLDEQDEALEMANEAIKRCLNLSTRGTIRAKVSYYYSSSLLARCYLIASIISAYSYERIPESIKKYKLPLMETSMHNLELALKTNSTDHLAYFHKALHKANNRLFSEAIDSVRQAIKLNPLYIPSISLLLLSLSALKMHEDALLLCDSSLREFKDNLTLLYIKCNLEQYLAETTCGYKSALNTCQHILKCIKQVSHLSAKKQSGVQKSVAALFKEDTSRDVVKCDDNNIACEYRIWLLVAEIFIKMGMLNDAEQCVEQASITASEAISHKVMYVRGLIAKANSNFVDAKSYFQSAIALQPRNSLALQQLAHVYYLLGNPSSAEKCLCDSLDLDSTSYLTWYYMSLVLSATERAGDAADCVMKAVSLQSSSPVIPVSFISRLAFG